MQKIVGIRSGRPDYSQSIEKNVLPVSPKPEVDKTANIFLNFKSEIPAQTTYTFILTDENGLTYPHAGKCIRTKRLVASTSADILIGVDLVAYDPASGGIMAIASDIAYQRVVLEPEFQTIEYPLQTQIYVGNYDTEKRLVQVYWLGSEESL
jgi:hypothetical protein